MLQKWNVYDRRRELPLSTSSLATTQKIRQKKPLPVSAKPKTEGSRKQKIVQNVEDENERKIIEIARLFPCPTYMVLLEMEVNDKLIKRCRRF